MKQEQYWSKRLEQIAVAGYDSSDAVMARLQKVYIEANSKIDLALTALYIQMLEDGEVSNLMLYKEARYINLQNAIRSELERLGGLEKVIMSDAFDGSYKKVFMETADLLNYSIDFIPKAQVEKVINANWMGRNFSNSIWNNKNKLLKHLEKSISNSITIGLPKDQAVQNIMKVMNTGFSNADRLVRTEMNFMVNQAQKDVYEAAGFNEYKILAAIDSRTSDICKEQNQKIYRFIDATAGVNYPPFHANCRTTVIPVFKDE